MAQTKLERTVENFNVFPKPFQVVLKRFVDQLVKDFVKSWYTYIGPEEEAFLKEVEKVLENIIVKIFFRLEKVELHDFVVKLIRMFQRHLKVFDDCRSIVLRKYPSIQENDFEICMVELYEAAVNKHIGTNNKGLEIDFLKSSLDMLLYKYLPKDAFSCESGRFMLREVLAIQLLEPIVKDVTDSYFVNQAIIDLLEPSIPLPILVKAYQSALLEIENKEIQLEKEMGNEPDEINSEHETQYESSHEDPKEIKTRKEIKKRKSLVEYSSLETNEPFLRFDNLDRKTAHPVHGLKSVRDHEHATSSKNSSSSVKDNSSDIHMQHDSAINSSKDLNLSAVSDNELNGSPSKNGWAVCPPSHDRVFRSDSFDKMLKKQDSISEQVVAKLKSVGPSLIPTNCLSSCSPDKNNPGDTHIPRDTLVLETRERSASNSGSMHMKFRRRQESQLSKSAEGKIRKSSDVDKETLSTAKSESNEVIRYHKSGEDGIFYQMAPSCPTCLEMTLLASPFEIDKATPILFEKKEKVVEHECGLVSKHFSYRQTDRENIQYDEFDDQSFASCDELTLNDGSSTSGTVLASTEANFVDIDKQNGKQITENYDIISSLSETSNISEDLTTDIDSSETEAVEAFSRNRNKKTSRSESIITYKTAIEQSFQYSDIQKKLKSPKNNSNQFINFLKSSIPLISKKKKHSKKKLDKKLIVDIKRKNGRHKRKRKRYNSENTHFESSSLSTSFTKFVSIPDSSSYSVFPPGLLKNKEGLVEEFIEEVAHEVIEDDEVAMDEELKHSQENLYPHESINLPVDPLSKEIAVTDKNLPSESRSVKSVKSSRSDPESKHSNEKSKGETTSYIPIFKGEVIMPHPSKTTAAWMYPIQMISIPSTEVALEKRWEPGINKYTLYNIHVSDV